MRALPIGLVALLVVSSLGCAAASTDAVPDEDAAAADELRASYTYRCSVLANQAGGAEAEYFLRVTSARVTWNTKKSFTKKGGAKVVLRDTDYTPRAAPTVRYEAQFTEGNVFWSHDWRLDPDLLTGGKPMRSGELGGFATFGTRVDWYSSAKYVCFAA